MKTSKIAIRPIVFPVVVLAMGVALGFQLASRGDESKTGDHQPIIVRQASVLGELRKANRPVGVRTIRKTDVLRINLVEIKNRIRLHRHPDAAHSVMVLEGRLEFTVGDREVVLEKGDFLEIPRNMPHGCKPVGGRALFVSMDAPYYDPARTVSLE